MIGARVNALAEAFLTWPLAAGLGLLCVYQLLAWFPHYLTWPWWTDHDVFATAARAWDAGILPYRDFHLNNFPGTIYLFWFLGKAFGWTATPALYAFDSALVVAFGLLLCVWSRVQFGRLVPGLAGFALFLSYYLSLNYSLTAQRDWHAAFLAAAALMALQTWPRGGWIAASVCTAVAFSIRPQVLVFAPALVLALEQQVRHPGDSWRRAVRRTLAFALCTAVGLAVLFLPLVRAGVFNDFLLALRTLRPGGGYSDTSIARFIRQVIATIAPSKVIVVPITLALIWSGASHRLRRLAGVWLVAYAGAFAYGLLSPRPHQYLLHPVMTIWSVLGALLVAIVLEDQKMTSSVSLALVLLVLASGVSLKPRFSDMSRSVRALAVLAGGADANPNRPPIGYAAMAESTGYEARYDWHDYHSLLDYLRGLPPTTHVANVLDGVPALTGPTGHLSVFPAESIALLTVASENQEALFAAALQHDANAVVVWSPAELHSRRHLPLPRLAAVIETNFRLEREFGEIEVWRRR